LSHNLTKFKNLPSCGERWCGHNR